MTDERVIWLRFCWLAASWLLVCWFMRSQCCYTPYYDYYYTRGLPKWALELLCYAYYSVDCTLATVSDGFVLYCSFYFYFYLSFCFYISFLTGSACFSFCFCSLSLRNCYAFAANPPCFFSPNPNLNFYYNFRLISACSAVSAFYALS